MVRLLPAVERARFCSVGASRWVKLLILHPRRVVSSRVGAHRFAHTHQQQSGKFIIKGPMQMKQLANQLLLAPDQLRDVFLKIGVNESDISSVVSSNTIEQILDYLKLPYENHIFTAEPLERRAPIVTIMGHIDHGKTTLLDTLRSSNIALGETGGITQRIGSFSAKDLEGNTICFVDTPGHFAFHSSRSRGVQTADILLIIIAVDDGIQDQTLECIRLARSQTLPTIVVVNKMDKVKHDSVLIQSKLVDYGIVTKKMGGAVDCVEISARTGMGIDNLLRVITENASSLCLENNSSTVPFGFILDCKSEISLGLTATVLLKSGMIQLGDVVESSNAIAKLKIIVDENGKRLKALHPATPAKIVGWKSEPIAGDFFEKRLKKKVHGSGQKTMCSSVEEALHHANYSVGNLRSGSSFDTPPEAMLESEFDRHLTGNTKSYSTLNPLVYDLIVKADSQGGIDAILQSLGSCQDRRVNFNILGCGIGIPTQEEIVVARNAKCNIYCFFPKTEYDSSQHTSVVSQKDSTHKIECHDIIYHMISSIKEDVESRMGPTINVAQLGTVAIKKVFQFTGKNKKFVAGCEVLTGCVLHDEPNIFCTISRDNKILTKVKIESLKYFNKTVTSVSAGSECGIILKDYKSFAENDIITVHKVTHESIPLDWSL